jgi:imidazolonepropionase-like amidohydrolase
MAPTTASETLWLDDLRIVELSDGTNRAAAIGMTDGVISNIEPEAPTGVTARALGGAHVLPGLISCHTHLQASYPYSARDPDEHPDVTFARASRQAQATLQAGITTVRTLHELHAIDLRVRAAITDGLVVGPRIIAAGRGLTVPGGHGDGLGCRVAAGQIGFRDAALAELDAGADHVKVFASGGLARAGEGMDTPEMTFDEMRGVVRAAETRGTYVVAHAASAAAIAQGLRAGIRSFEHAYRLDEPTARDMERAGAWLTPTLVVTHSAAWQRRNGFDESSIDRCTDTAPGHEAGIRYALDAGVNVVNGTDFPPGSLDDGVPLAVREMQLLVQLGAYPLAAIRSATIDAARLVHREDLGRVAIGAPADLIAVAGDPVADISAMERVSLVVAAGRIVRGALVA